MKWFKRKYSPVIYVLLSVAVIYSLEIVVNPVIFEKKMEKHIILEVVLFL